MNKCNLRLLIGLGNPGSKYVSTRHNVGFLVLEKIARQQNLTFRQSKKLYGLIAETSFGANSLRLLMPTTYMNESGKSIKAAIDWFGLEVEEILILVDDMDLPLGRMRVRSQGSSGGHNGLKSIIQHLGTQNFCRVRIGIGPPKNLQSERKKMAIPHVLGRFNSHEIPIINDVINEVIEGLDIIEQLGIDRAATRMNSYNAKNCISQ